jgi:hypothetical protein
MRSDDRRIRSGGQYGSTLVEDRDLAVTTHPLCERLRQSAFPHTVGSADHDNLSRLDSDDVPPIRKTILAPIGAVLCTETSLFCDRPLPSPD